MADTSSTKKRSTKRRVKSPETFRERALRASEPNDKVARVSKLKQGSRKLARPLGSPAKKLFGRQPFKLLGKVLGVVGKVLLPPYVRKSWRELRQVTWPNWKQSRQLTFAVLVFAVIFGAAIALVDWGLDKVFKQLLLK